MMTGHGPSGRPAWLSYDSVADTYEQVAVPWFTALARDLVAAVDPQPNEIVLDVGTGTGLVAATVRRLEPTAVAVGIDPSAGMLAVARSRNRVTPVAAMAPGLPLRDGVFDAVAANLVLSHLPDHTAGLADIVRVLRRGGRLGCTAWAPSPPTRFDNVRPEADQVVDAIREELGLDADPPTEAAPWEEWFHDPDHLRTALMGAGLTEPRVEPREYRWTFRVADFLSGWGSRGRYMRFTAGEPRWHEFVRRASAALHARYGDEIAVVNLAWIVTARRP